MTVCDAQDCPRRATQVGVAELPIRPLELRLCDEHVEALRAGKVRGLSQGTGWRNDGARPQVSFSD
ncbi:hypothetical protein SAMN05660662_0982 [Blastococcus aurantiacus]|uniref:Uncharacterized protein n=1 Tax=Blastococcus aurantiacus TaxID=1550231 RepID=A0A1G7I4B0_9ACTN|nr:hypothetical protein [Blastococcus aurantiacus]SDF07224.1 hypothetical protein SAMN05660662_0982 [Blastococcus aurantiacus]